MGRTGRTDGGRTISIVPKFQIRHWDQYSNVIKSVLDDFSMCLHHIFERGFCIDFSLIGDGFDIIFTCFLMNVPFAHSPCNTFRFDDPYNELACFYTSQKYGCSLFVPYCSVAFVALIVRKCGIDFRSMFIGVFLIADKTGSEF